MKTIMEEDKEKDKKKQEPTLLQKRLLYGSCIILMVGISAYILLGIFIFFL